MSVGNFTQQFQINAADIIFCGTSPPSASSWYAGLCTSGSLTEANTLTDFVNAEVVAVGYQRQACPFTSITTSSYDSTNKRAPLPTVTLSFTAPSTNSIQFSSLFLIAGTTSASANGNQIVSSVSGNTLTLPTAVSNGQYLVMTADSGGSLPTGLSTDTLYEAINVSGSTCQLALPSAPTTPISLSSVGSGTIRARYADGWCAYYDSSMGTVTIPAGTTYNFQVQIVALNSGYVAGT